MRDYNGLLLNFVEPSEFLMSERDRTIWRYYDDGCSRLGYVRYLHYAR